VSRVVIGIFGVIPATVAAAYPAIIVATAFQGRLPNSFGSAAFLLIAVLALVGTLGLWLCLLRGPSFSSSLCMGAGILSVILLFTWVLLQPQSGSQSSFSFDVARSFAPLLAPVVVAAHQIMRFWRNSVRRASRAA
jgi:hypothetical protein